MKNENLNQPPIRRFYNQVPEQFKGFVDFPQTNMRNPRRHQKWNKTTQRCINSIQYLLDEGIIERDEN